MIQKDEIIDCTEIAPYSDAEEYHRDRVLHSAFLEHWNILIVAASDFYTVRTLKKRGGGDFVLLNAADEAKELVVPNKSFPIGIAVDFTCTIPTPNKAGEAGANFPLSPVIYVLTSDGALRPFGMADTIGTDAYPGIKEVTETTIRDKPAVIQQAPKKTTEVLPSISFDAKPAEQPKLSFDFGTKPSEEPKTTNTFSFGDKPFSAENTFEAPKDSGFGSTGFGGFGNFGGFGSTSFGTDPAPKETKKKEQTPITPLSFGTVSNQPFMEPKQVQKTPSFEKPPPKPEKKQPVVEPVKPQPKKPEITQDIFDTKPKEQPKSAPVVKKTVVPQVVFEPAPVQTKKAPVVAPSPVRNVPQQAPAKPIPRRAMHEDFKDIIQGGGEIEQEFKKIYQDMDQKLAQVQQWRQDTKEKLDRVRRNRQESIPDKIERVNTFSKKVHTLVTETAEEGLKSRISQCFEQLTTTIAEAEVARLLIEDLNDDRYRQAIIRRPLNPQQKELEDHMRQTGELLKRNIEELTHLMNDHVKLGSKRRNPNYESTVAMIQRTLKHNMITAIAKIEHLERLEKAYVRTLKQRPKELSLMNTSIMSREFTSPKGNLNSSNISLSSPMHTPIKKIPQSKLDSIRTALLTREKGSSVRKQQPTPQYSFDNRERKTLQVQRQRPLNLEQDDRYLDSPDQEQHKDSIFDISQNSEYDQEDQWEQSGASEPAEEEYEPEPAPFMRNVKSMSSFTDYHEKAQAKKAPSEDIFKQEKPKKKENEITFDSSSSFKAPSLGGTGFDFPAPDDKKVEPPKKPSNQFNGFQQPETEPEKPAFGGFTIDPPKGKGKAKTSESLSGFGGFTLQPPSTEAPKKKSPAANESWSFGNVKQASPEKPKEEPKSLSPPKETVDREKLAAIHEKRLHIEKPTIVIPEKEKPKEKKTDLPSFGAQFGSSNFSLSTEKSEETKPLFGSSAPSEFSFGTENSKSSFGDDKPTSETKPSFSFGNEKSSTPLSFDKPSAGNDKPISIVKDKPTPLTLGNDKPPTKDKPTSFGDLPLSFGDNKPVSFGENKPVEFGNDKPTTPLSFGNDKPTAPLNFGNDKPLVLGGDKATAPLSFDKPKEKSTTPLSFGDDKPSFSFDTKVTEQKKEDNPTSNWASANPFDKPASVLEVKPKTPTEPQVEKSPFDSAFGSTNNSFGGFNTSISETSNQNNLDILANAGNLSFSNTSFGAEAQPMSTGFGFDKPATNEPLAIQQPKQETMFSPPQVSNTMSFGADFGNAMSEEPMSTTTGFMSTFPTQDTSSSFGQTSGGGFFEKPQEGASLLDSTGGLGGFTPAKFDFAAVPSTQPSSGGVLSGFGSSTSGGFGTGSFGSGSFGTTTTTQPMTGGFVSGGFGSSGFGTTTTQPATGGFGSSGFGSSSFGTTNTQPSTGGFGAMANMSFGNDGTSGGVSFGQTGFGSAPQQQPSAPLGGAGGFGSFSGGGGFGAVTASTTGFGQGITTDPFANVSSTSFTAMRNSKQKL